MSVMVDDKPLAAEQLGLRTVGQVLAHVQKENRLVVHLLIDGQEPDLARLPSLRTAPLAGHTLYVETAEPRKLALDVLGELEQHLVDTDQMRLECVDLLRASNTSNALERLR